MGAAVGAVVGAAVTALLVREGVGAEVAVAELMGWVAEIALGADVGAALLVALCTLSGGGATRRPASLAASSACCCCSCRFATALPPLEATFEANKTYT